ncbi:adenylate/guanylate cyclase domain-containing protein [Williamsia sp. CHRR-6]|nr:adenylate/guanylate cyclase domain-containing protein [Williamsia sp. CHRR-6]
MFLGGPPAFTREQAISELDIDPDYADEIWRAFGFAHDPSDTAIFTEDDLAAMGLIRAAYEDSSSDAAVGAARTVGQAMARLAEWQAYRLTDLDGDPAVAAGLAELAVAMERVHTLVWRRHLVAALRNVRQQKSTESDTTTTTVGFCDIVGYTSLSRRIGNQELTELLDTFESKTTAIITEHGGVVVKTLGDAVMFTVPQPNSAAAIALEVHAISETAPSIPPLRVGLAYGEVLSRYGDVFGEPVNIAARLTGSARPGTSLCDAALADAIDDDRFYVKSIGTLNVRGYRHLKARVIEPNRGRVSEPTD